MTLTIGSLFSGIGGLELGLEWAGLGPVLWQVEKDPFCRRVLAKHWPNVARFHDVTTVGGAALARVEVICGGFPCQDVSAAGRGDGLTETSRSGLWFDFARVVGELRPRVVIVENVASGMRRWLPTVRRGLHLLGYDSTAYQLSAADVGAPHLRRRIFVVAHADRLASRQSGRSCRPRRRAPSLAPLDGVERTLAHADREGQLRQAAPGVEGRDRPSYGGDGRRGPWAAEPLVGRVAHGLPGRLDRLRGLGNAVVPECAEVIGRVVATLFTRVAEKKP